MVDFLDYCVEKKVISKASATELLAKHKQLRKKEDSEHYIADLLPKWVDYEYEKAKGKLKKGSAVGKTKPIRGFFTFYRVPLIIRKHALDVDEEISSDFTFTQSILKNMASVVDIEGKAKIYCGKDLGLRISDFRTLKRKPIVQQIQLAEAKQIEYPIEFEVKTMKEGVVAKCHLMFESVEALRQYWKTIPDSEYAFPNHDHTKPCTERTLNYLLKTAFQKAFPQITEHAQIRFHALRDFFISALANSNVNKWAIKRMVGKKISKDMADYVKGLDLKALFKQTEPKLTLSGLTNSNHTKIEHIEEENEKLKQALALIYKVAKEKGLTEVLPQIERQALEEYLLKPKEEKKDV
ncbi:tyrosine-type recombinase/integrase [Candidatus Bathyarchaeota archaeon]|nr:tyrosine-type recombinase/integrase [Candidatus Bathyarchaeota archaeon]